MGLPGILNQRPSMGAPTPPAGCSPRLRLGLRSYLAPAGPPARLRARLPRSVVGHTLNPQPTRRAPGIRVRCSVGPRRRTRRSCLALGPPPVASGGRPLRGPPPMRHPGAGRLARHPWRAPPPGPTAARFPSLRSAATPGAPRSGSRLARWVIPARASRWPAGCRPGRDSASRIRSGLHALRVEASYVPPWSRAPGSVVLRALVPICAIRTVKNRLITCGQNVINSPFLFFHMFSLWITRELSTAYPPPVHRCPFHFPLHSALPLLHFRCSCVVQLGVIHRFRFPYYSYEV